MSGFEYADSGRDEASKAKWEAYLNALETERSLREAEVIKGALDKGDRIAKEQLRRLARKRTPAQEVEALLEALKTETGFVRPVKWGK